MTNRGFERELLDTLADICTALEGIGAEAEALVILGRELAADKLGADPLSDTPAVGGTRSTPARTMSLGVSP